MADGKGEERKLSPPVTVTDEYLAELVRLHRELLEELRKKPLVPPEVTLAKEPVKRGR